jgi:hypothetical protein
MKAHFCHDWRISDSNLTTMRDAKRWNDEKMATSRSGAFVFSWAMPGMNFAAVVPIDDSASNRKADLNFVDPV